MITEKARIAKVKFAADLELECLMLPDGSFGIGVSQIASVFSLPQNHATKYVKALLGKDISLPQIKSELNSQAVNYITLQQFVSVCRALDKKGNEIAGRLIEIHIEASFTSIVSSAFGVKFTQEQVVAFVAARETHRKGYHPKYTKWLKSDGAEVQGDYVRGITQLKQALGLPVIPVDEYDEKQLEQINTGELIYDRLRSKGLDHDSALDLL